MAAHVKRATCAEVVTGASIAYWALETYQSSLWAAARTRGGHDTETFARTTALLCIPPHGNKPTACSPAYGSSSSIIVGGHLADQSAETVGKFTARCMAPPKHQSGRGELELSVRSRLHL